jgi:hypothetical protein
MPDTIDEISKDHGKVHASWDYSQFSQTKRTLFWYIIMAVIIAGFVIFGILSNNYLFIIIVVILVVIYAMRFRRKPVQLTFQISEDGIVPDPKTFYAWKDIKDFWIIYEPPEIKSLYFGFKSGLRPSLTISLENQNPLTIRKTLLAYIPEDPEKENESFTDGLSRMLKL